MLCPLHILLNQAHVARQRLNVMPEFMRQRLPNLRLPIKVRVTSCNLFK